MRMGRGTFYLMLAEVMFVLSGWIIHISAGYILGKEHYGDFVILLILLTLYRLFIQTGVNRAVSKYIAEGPSRARLIRRQALKLQMIIGLISAGAIWIAAPMLARYWQKSALAGPIRLTAVFLPVFGIYSVYRGSLNGLKLFGREAKISMLYSLIKVVCFFALIYILGLYGAVGGYLAAIIAATVLARMMCPIGGGMGETFPVLKIVRFAVPVVLFGFIIALIGHIDMLIARHLLPADLAEKVSSYYGAAQQFARVPYMLLYALSLTLFPNIASSTSIPGGEQVTSQTIRKALRAGLLIVLPIACLISAEANEVISWVYPRIDGGGEALRLLIFGQVFLSFLLILTTILTASGRPWLSFLLVGATLAAAILLNYLLIPIHGILGAAAATTIASGSGALLAALLVLRYFRVLIAVSSLFKIVTASGVLYGAAFLISAEGFFIPPVFLLLAGGYLLLLLAFGEIDRADWKMLKSLFRKEKTEPFF